MGERSGPGGRPSFKANASPATHSVEPHCLVSPTHPHVRTRAHDVPGQDSVLLTHVARPVCVPHGATRVFTCKTKRRFCSKTKVHLQNLTLRARQVSSPSQGRPARPLRPPALTPRISQRHLKSLYEETPCFGPHELHRVESGNDTFERLIHVKGTKRYATN